VANDPLIVRCWKCKGTLIFKRIREFEIEVYHTCDVFCTQERDQLAKEVESLGSVRKQDTDPMTPTKKLEDSRTPHEGSGIFAPAPNCHCKKYGHDRACSVGKRCLCAYCESYASFAHYGPTNTCARN
jgi:hypothetical protein